MKRTPLRPRSKKRQREIVARRALVSRMLAESPWCEMRLPGCYGTAVDLHERLTRARGGSILDEANIVRACRSCHSIATENPELADSLGLTVHSWSAS